MQTHPLAGIRVLDFTQISGPRHPAGLIDMAHSPAYFMAAAAADRGFGRVHTTPEKINDPAIRRLFDKVRVGPQPTGNVADLIGLLR